MSKLFEPIKINGLELKNRIVMTGVGLHFNEKGPLDERFIEMYRARAKGGAGAIVVVSPVNREAAYEWMIHVNNNETIEGFKRLADACHEYDCKVFGQLIHMARLVPPYADVKNVAPSAVASPIVPSVPHELTVEEIHGIIDDYAAAAENLKAAGVDGLEVQCGGSYLPAEFMSVNTNFRTDEYGPQSFENRTRFIKEVFRAVREKVGSDFPLVIRLGAAEMTNEKGYGLDFTTRLAKELEDEGLIDGLGVLGGWHESRIPLITYNVPDAALAHMGGAFKQILKVPVLQSVRINSPEVAEKVLNGGFADVIGAARAFWADPEFVNKIKEGKSYNPCQGCNRGCIDKAFADKEMTCAFNPEFGLEYKLSQGLHNDGSKLVLVVGGGPGGLYAAYTAAKRGYKVVLAEASERLGGLLNVASKPTGKASLEKYVENKIVELTELGAEIRLNQKVDRRFIEGLEPDIVIVATGAEPAFPPVKGIDKELVIQAQDVLTGSDDLIADIKHGKTVIIGGGSVGLETAEFLADRSFISDEAEMFWKEHAIGEGPYGMFYIPLDITIVEMEKKMGRGMNSIKGALLGKLKEKGVKMQNLISVKEITDNAVLAEDADGNPIVYPADTVIVATGYRPKQQDFIPYLEKEGIKYAVIGDAVKSRDFMSALREALDLFLESKLA